MLRFGGTKRAGPHSPKFDGGDNDIDCAIVVESLADYDRVRAKLYTVCQTHSHILNCTTSGWGIRFFTGYRNFDREIDSADGRETYTVDLVPARMEGDGRLHNGERFGPDGIPTSSVFPLRPVQYNENVTMWVPREFLAAFSALQGHEKNTFEYGRGCRGVAYPPWLVKEYAGDTDPYTKVRAAEQQF